jgi:hypothetical protein
MEDNDNKISSLLLNQMTMKDKNMSWTTKTIQHPGKICKNKNDIGQNDDQNSVIVYCMTSC